ncbi:hypothetical protein DNTS_025531 [Danionella cerebrum]|uniref:Uncharacterized protein n=1 Tax=Danionella cerebrum TaxID=2873325 RepID=A0A553MY79_9TELE|nr:hypothetical protein DNTS_025531 [Danionella translucida]
MTESSGITVSDTSISAVDKGKAFRAGNASGLKEAESVRVLEPRVPRVLLIKTREDVSRSGAEKQSAGIVRKHPETMLESLGSFIRQSSWNRHRLYQESST